MTNKELFARGNDWEIEQNLCFLLQEFWEKASGDKYSQPPVNPVAFVKKFLKEETIVNYEITDLAKMREIEKTAIDADFKEVE